MQPSYSIEIEKQLQEVFDRLSEKDKRLYAGVEALTHLRDSRLSKLLIFRCIHWVACRMLS